MEKTWKMKWTLGLSRSCLSSMAGFFLAGSSSLAVFSSMAVTESPDEVPRFSLPAFGRA